MAYADLSAELAGTLPGLSPLLAATYVRRAWREIRNARNWSFKTAVATLVCPPQITTGTVALTQFSSSITFSVAATAALTPYVAGTPLLTTLQVRFSNGPLYRILAVTAQAPNLIVTLDRPVTEVTAPLASYAVYRAYISPPVPDFTRWESLDDMAGQRTLRGPALTRSAVEFDARDPGRTSAGPVQYLGSFIADATGLLLYELWPHPTQGQTFTVTFKRSGPEFALPTDTQPDIIPDSLIMARALGWHGYPWAVANQARVADLKGAGYVGLIQASRAAYQLDYTAVRLQDEERSLQSVYNRGHWGGGRTARDTPLGDAAYWQQHPIYW